MHYNLILVMKVPLPIDYVLRRQSIMRRRSRSSETKETEGRRSFPFFVMIIRHYIARIVRALSNFSLDEISRYRGGAAGKLIFSPFSAAMYREKFPFPRAMRKDFSLKVPRRAFFPSLLLFIPPP